jgi:hypothetical protein
MAGSSFNGGDVSSLGFGTNVFALITGWGGSWSVVRNIAVGKALDAYQALYGDRVLKSKNKQPRRDVGVRQDLEERKRRRMERGAPQPEAEFLRDQCSAIRKLLQSAKGYFALNLECVFRLSTGRRVIGLLVIRVWEL